MEEIIKKINHFIDHIILEHFGLTNEQLEWVKCMNNYKNIAEEIVNNELIFC